MAQTQIKFGTDGWRAVIADNYTFANVRIAAEAIAAYVHALEQPSKGIASARHTLRLQAFARTCAEVVAAQGIPVLWPTASRPHLPELRGGQARLAGGIMITSSHNPAQWNGVKYKGGTAARASLHDRRN